VPVEPLGAPEYPAVSTEAQPRVIALVAARNEADRIGATVRTLAEAMPRCTVVVADDCSDDETAAVAAGNGATVVTSPRSLGKGGNMTNAAATLTDLAEGSGAPIFLLCDGDLGDTAGRLRPLVDAVASGDCDLAIAAFRRRVGGGFGLALRYARWAIRRRCGYEAGAPISGQRALTAEAFRTAYPFAGG
jgi:glycosyltransferase involved in cell wall biosynthesis